MALVTGASRGLGKAMAVALAQAGAHVVCAGRDVDALRAVVEEEIRRGGTASMCVMDVLDEAAVRSGVQSVVSEHGRLDILCNNAGVIARKELGATSVADWGSVLDVNLRGAFIVARECARHMGQGQGHGHEHGHGHGGRIINTLSALSVVGRAGR